MGAEHRLWVDNQTHTLHLDGQTFRCDRDIETALPWRQYALLLSSDTDCLSLWDTEGLLRIARVGVYPQDMALAENQVIVCGGADGRLYELSLPDLQLLRTTVLPGMPERICIVDHTAFILMLLTEPEVHTSLVKLLLTCGHWTALRKLSGIPEAIAADRSGLWLAGSDGMMRLRWEEITT